MESLCTEEIRTNMYNTLDGFQLCLCIFHVNIRSPEAKKKRDNTQMNSI